MKDKTLAMNRGMSAEDLARGFADAGAPELTNAPHKRRMEQGGLARDKALSDFENVDGDDGGQVLARGFLRRNNYDERF
jgi:hypothetical protein